MDQCWMCVSCAPSRVLGCGSSESHGWAWHARQNESLCWQQFLCWVPAGVKPLAVPGNCRCVPRVVTGSCCCRGWWLPLSLLAVSCLSCLLGWWQGHALSFPVGPRTGGRFTKSSQSQRLPAIAGRQAGALPSSWKGSYRPGCLPTPNPAPTQQPPSSSHSLPGTEEAFTGGGRCCQL